MTERHTLIAFLSTLFSIVALVITGAFIAIQGYSTEALGIGGAVTGLIGICGTFKPRTTSPDHPQEVQVMNTPKDAVPVLEESTNVSDIK